MQGQQGYPGSPGLTGDQGSPVCQNSWGSGVGGVSLTTLLNFSIVRVLMGIQAP